jgi:NADPH:quinone reductase-like Zn-dependent oxidoreductase
MTQWREPSHRPNGAALLSPLANHQGRMLISKSPDLSKGSYYLSRPTLFHFVGDRSWLDSTSVKLFKAVTDGTINVLINQRFSLEDVAKAHEALTGRATTGCTILTV